MDLGAATTILLTIPGMTQLAQIDPALEDQAQGRQLHLWLQVLSLSILTVWLYSSVFFRLVLQWWKDPNFSHGFFVPIFSLFLLLNDRSRLRSLVPKPSAWGLLIVVLAMGLLILGSLGAELFLSRISLLFTILGLIVLLGGWGHCRAMLFPWAFLLLMIPIPAILFNQVTVPLQLLASRLAAGMLPLLGVPVLREGNVINLPAMSLEVAEACSGIRSLVSLITLAIIYGYLTEKTRSVRLLLAIAAVPIAVCANALRIVGTGLLVQYWGPDKAQGFFHLFSGWFLFLLSLAMLFLLHQVLSWLRQAKGVSQ